jgi:hypothetical protein
MRQRGLESGAHQLAHQRGGRVVAAARAPLIGIHHAFEHAAQHVGRDELTGIVLAHREMKALEQIVEGRAPIGVAPHGGAVPALECRRLE